MPLNQNPFFVPIMQSIEMIAQDNQRKQAEERENLRQQNFQDQAYERQIQTEERQFAKEEKVHEREEKEKEAVGLQESANEFLRAKGSGVKVTETDEMLYKSSNERLSTLQKEGTQIRYPKYNAPKQEYILDEKVAKHFHWGEDRKVSEDTKRILHAQYEEDMATLYGKKTGGGGKEETLTNPLAIINKRRELANSRYAQGLMTEKDTEKLGLSAEIHGSYLNYLKQIEDKLLTGQLKEADAIKMLTELEDYDVFYNKNTQNKDALNTALKELIETLSKMNE